MLKFFLSKGEIVTRYQRKPTSSILPTSHSDIGAPISSKDSGVAKIALYKVHVLILHENTTPQYCTGKLYIRHGHYQLESHFFFTSLDIELDSLPVVSLERKLTSGIGARYEHIDDLGEKHQARVMIFDTSEHAMTWQNDFLCKTSL